MLRRAGSLLRITRWMLRIWIFRRGGGCVGRTLLSAAFFDCVLIVTSFVPTERRGFQLQSSGRNLLQNAMCVVDLRHADRSVRATRAIRATLNGFGVGSVEG